MYERPQRYHWLNTIVGVIDQSLHLDDEERIRVVEIVSRLLDSLDIPGREDPTSIPAPLALEISSGIYSSLLSGGREAGFAYEARYADQLDIVVSVESWCAAILAMITTAYPDITGPERLVAATVLTQMFDAIGVPDRAATFFPDDVVRISREIDA
jgi:hypothetical protein